MSSVDEIRDGAVEFIRDKLYYVALRSPPRRVKGCDFLCIDTELVYWNFFLDFGPLNLGQTFRFCQALKAKLEDPDNANQRVVYYSSTNPQKRANAAFLICAFSILYLGRTPEEAYEPFENVYPPFPPFHDATPCSCSYKLSVMDCLRGLDKAVKLKYFNLRTFDVEEYEYFERVEYGDLNWIADGKFLAFAGPHETRSSSPEGYHCLVPEDYIPYFKKRNVTLVIRLNKKYYDERRFTRAGIKHVDLYYLDGSTPPEHILQKFIEICEGNKGAIAVHCKAGLGRTGTCINMYLMKHHNISAAECIGWNRITRPGSVIGPQQHYLEDNEERMKMEGVAYRNRHKQRGSGSKAHNFAGGLSVDSKAKGSTPKHSAKYDGYQDKGQGDALRSRKSPKAILGGAATRTFQAISLKK